MCNFFGFFVLSPPASLSNAISGIVVVFSSYISEYGCANPFFPGLMGVSSPSGWSGIVNFGSRALSWILIMPVDLDLCF